MYNEDNFALTPNQSSNKVLQHGHFLGKYCVIHGWRSSLTEPKLVSLSAAICDAHNMPAQYVIHVHSPPWGNDASVDNLEKAVKNVLTLADEKNIKTIALPSIGSGA